MKPKSSVCDRELLRQSLHDWLPEDQENELADHLSQCAACQQELEELAAGTELSDLEKILRQEAERSRHGWAEVGLHAGLGLQRSSDDYVNSLADFAVDFLGPPATPQSLGRLGDIDIQEWIGNGSMGIVLKGFQQELNRPVAVKVLAPHLASSGAARKRFAREAQATAVIVHPNVMPILTVNSSGKLPYLVMPHVACESLQHRLDREGPLETIDILRIAMQVAAGLAAAHAQGLVHRDIKPANILLEKGINRAMLTDFGLARAVDDATLTRTGVIAGTPQYMSPEQARGESVDARSDLFSLGSVLYAMCTGRPPFRAESSYGILRRITDTEPRPIREINPEPPDWLVAVIAKLHAKNRADRFPSAEALATSLEQCLAHVQQPAITPLPKSVATLSRRAALEGVRTEVGGKTRKRTPRSLLFGLTSAALIILATILGISVWLHQSDSRDRSKRPSGSGSSAASSFSESEPSWQNTPSAGWDGAGEPIRDMTPEFSLTDLADRYEFDFREGRFDRERLMPVGDFSLYTWMLLKPEPRGLRITIPWHQGKDKPTLGITPAFTIHGDFQITARYELVAADTPEIAVPVGGQIHIMTQETHNAASILRGVMPGRQGYFLFLTIRDETVRMPFFETVAADSRRGKLRFVRAGEMLHLLVAEEESDQFRKLAEVDFGTEPISMFCAESVTNGAACTAETLWSGIDIRADELQPVENLLHDNREEESQ
jgi:serine/threonine-protein kinase